jgi:hypothetical protein
MLFNFLAHEFSSVCFQNIYLGQDPDPDVLKNRLLDPDKNRLDLCITLLIKKEKII